MIMVIPNEWKDSNNVLTIHRPVSLISGNRLTVFSSTVSVSAFLRAGVQLKEVGVEDYIHFLYWFPGPNGGLAHTFPTSYNQYIPT